MKYLKLILPALIIAVTVTAVTYSVISILGLVSWNFGQKLVYALASTISCAATLFSFKWLADRAKASAIVPILALLLLSLPAFSMTERLVPKGTNGTPNGYIEYTPPGYDGVKQFPTLIWWHGLGEVGPGSLSSLTALSNKHICPWLRANDVPFIVLVPQDANGWGKAQPFVVWALSKYPAINRGALHMAGLSSGGYMIRDFINGNTTEYKLFSTFTPMATNLDAAIPNVRQIVDNNQFVWAHAGELDKDANMPGAQARFIKALQALAPSRGQITIYKGIVHSAWYMTYDASGKAAAEISATTWEGAVLFKWVDTPVTWWAWMLEHSKDLSTTPPDPEPIPDVDVKRTFYRSDSLVFELTDGRKFRVYVSPQ